uniref:Uncharacterized protein n=1 Tax=Arundo donax TaxID=35708 RepID=A0A0A8XUB9_ARUDO
MPKGCLKHFKLTPARHNNGGSPSKHGYHLSIEGDSSADHQQCAMGFKEIVTPVVIDTAWWFDSLNDTLNPRHPWPSISVLIHNVNGKKILSGCIDSIELFLEKDHV